MRPGLPLAEAGMRLANDVSAPTKWVVHPWLRDDSSHGQALFHALRWAAVCTDVHAEFAGLKLTHMVTGRSGACCNINCWSSSMLMPDELRSGAAPQPSTGRLEDNIAAVRMLDGKPMSSPSPGPHSNAHCDKDNYCRATRLSALRAARGRMTERVPCQGQVKEYSETLRWPPIIREVRTETFPECWTEANRVRPHWLLRVDHGHLVQGVDMEGAVLRKHTTDMTRRVWPYA
eukprot:357252-Chlamydomonas_euryale.AAC.5